MNFEEIRAGYVEAIARLLSAFVELREQGGSLEEARLLYERALQEVRMGQARAWQLGRALAEGRPLRVDPTDAARARLLADEQEFFLRRLLERIREGKVSGAQADLYASFYGARLRGTVNEAFVVGSPAPSRFWWALRAAEHCRDCPTLAARSPYTARTLYTYPGHGDTECIMNCKCVLIREDGTTSPEA